MLNHLINCSLIPCFLDTSPSDKSLTRKKKWKLYIVVDRTEILTVMVMTLYLFSDIFEEVVGVKYSHRSRCRRENSRWGSRLLHCSLLFHPLTLARRCGWFLHLPLLCCRCTAWNQGNTKLIKLLQRGEKWQTSWADSYTTHFYPYQKVNLLIWIFPPTSNISWK